MFILEMKISIISKTTKIKNHDIRVKNNRVCVLDMIGTGFETSLILMIEVWRIIDILV